MAYCRFSTDDFQCDVYVYEDVSGGWTTHVAAMKYVFQSPLPPPVPLSDFDKWWERHDRVTKMVVGADHVSIGLPHDGESFNDPTPGACADRLEELRKLGYRVPQYVIDSLRLDPRFEQGEGE